MATHAPSGATEQEGKLMTALLLIVSIFAAIQWLAAHIMVKMRHGKNNFRSGNWMWQDTRRAAFRKGRRTFTMPLRASSIIARHIDCAAGISMSQIRPFHPLEFRERDLLCELRLPAELINVQKAV
jgi:hypothetical protein